jgi:hypothetical protein
MISTTQKHCNVYTVETFNDESFAETLIDDLNNDEVVCIIEFIANKYSYLLFIVKYTYENKDYFIGYSCNTSHEGMCVNDIVQTIENTLQKDFEEHSDEIIDEGGFVVTAIDNDASYGDKQLFAYSVRATATGF